MATSHPVLVARYTSGDNRHERQALLVTNGGLPEPLVNTRPNALSGETFRSDGVTGFAIRHDHRGGEYYCSTDYSIHRELATESDLV